MELGKSIDLLQHADDKGQGFFSVDQGAVDIKFFYLLSRPRNLLWEACPFCLRFSMAMEVDPEKPPPKMAENLKFILLISLLPRGKKMSKKLRVL